MESPFERLKIQVTEDQVDITVESETETISFGGVAPIADESIEIPNQFYRLNPSERPEEYVVSLEFDRGSDEEGVALARLDAHLREVKVRLHDDGYIIEGELTSWIGYTDALLSSRG